MTVAKLYRKTRLFRSLNPNFKVPPKALAYDAYSAPDWDFYKKSGIQTAAFLLNVAQRYLPRDVATPIYMAPTIIRKPSSGALKRFQKSASI